MLGFRLLAHAEIEQFVEECAERLALHYAGMIDQQRWSTTLSARTQRTLLLNLCMVDKYPPLSITRPRPSSGNKDPLKNISSGLNRHQSVISGNNGVSEKDILKLFVPLGFDLHFFDHSWLIAMNNLAKSRGEVAHNSFQLSTQAIPTPRGERDLLVVPLFGLRRVVDEVVRLQAAA
ncbi:HEPN domain-containing protein [Micromonospora sp. NPDC004551]|uniref:HEPN domain-containing protein n=1 Tax=Micromonospora sp. NPDC004551 TaxID=3154284 RepID=UPI0033A573D4